jgi:2-oxoisovalerate ferredoxin oxidoreductase beta subunit
VQGLGFSLVEILSPCPTIWKMTPVEAQRWVRENMTRAFPLGVYRDRTKEAELRPVQTPPPALAEIPRILGLREGASASDAQNRPAAVSDWRVRVAGFGGQGVLLLGQVLVEAGMDAGQEVSWLPSYGPEMRSGTSNCHVRLSTRPIDSPLVSRPNVLLALNEPSLRKFLPALEPGGWVLYNGTSLPEDCRRSDVQALTLPFTRLADEIGEARTGNIVMLGALLEITGALETESVIGALRRLVKSERWLELDVRALARGRQAARERNCP